MESFDTPTAENIITTKLVIEKDKNIEKEFPEQKTSLNTKGLRVARSGFNTNGYDYYSLNDLSHTRKLSITLKEANQEKDIQLPERMLKNIAEYLANQKNVDERFDCTAFAHAANGVPYTIGEPDPYKWQRGKFDERNIKPGETFVIGREMGFGFAEFTHWAIYLGDGLYLSKAGKSGEPLIVADLEEMKKGYDGDVVYKMTPIRKYRE